MFAIVLLEMSITSS